MVFAFDRFILDSSRAELRCDGVPLAIEPQVFDLLEVLVSSCGRVVSRDEIFKAIWGDRIVSDAALASRIRDARRAIGDDGASQRLIRTVHRRGLRFVGDVSGEADGESGAVLSELRAAGEPLFERPAIAVLPFRDISDSGADALTERLDEALTAAFSAWRIFPVVSRLRAAHYADAGSATLAAETGARYAVSGTVRLTDAGIRLQVDLTHIEADTLLWSDRIAREK